jgi:maltose/moltooligosaccharide transporter
MVIPYIKNTKMGYALSLLLGAAGFISMTYVTDQYMLFVSFALIGCAWAATLAYPFTLLTNALEGKGHMGTYLGLFNGTICLPQIVAAVLGGVILQALPLADNGASNQPMMMFIAGVFLVTGAAAVFAIKEK